MSDTDLITLPRMASRVPDLVADLPSLIKGSRMSKFNDPDAPIGLGLAIQRAADLNPDGAAVLYRDTRITYTRFNAWANRIAHYLLAVGLEKGDVVAVDIENRPELLALVVGCAKIGVVNALINTSQRGRVLTHSYNLVKPALAVVGEERRKSVEEINDQLDLSGDVFYWLADQDTLEEPGSAPEGYLNLAEMVREYPEVNPGTVNGIFMQDPLFYIYTSGTTGLPKAVVFNHGRWWKAYGGFGFMAVRLSQHDRMYCALPLYHATGMVISWASAIAAGAALVLARRFSASRFWEDIRRYDCTAFTYIGELCRYLMEQPERPDDRDNKVRLMVGNGMRPAIWKPFKARFGIERVVELYASSEGNVAFTNIFNFDNTVGFSPADYAIVKYDKENEAPIRDKKGFMIKADKGEPGLLLGKVTEETPFDGYTDREKTQKAVTHDVFETGDAYFDTGDLMRDIGFRHAQFVDRLGDTFRWKGENVSTTEVEQIMDSAGGIVESVVYGVEMPASDGRAGMACVRLTSDAETFDWQTLADYLKAELPAYAIPVFIRVRTQTIQTTGTFKHLKTGLKEQAYDLSRQNDPVYVWLPRGKGYQRLKPEQQKAIDNNEYRF